MPPERHVFTLPLFGGRICNTELSRLIRRWLMGKTFELKGEKSFEPKLSLQSVTGVSGDSPQISTARCSDSLFSFRQTPPGSKGSWSGNWIRCLVFCLKLLELEIAHQGLGNTTTCLWRLYQNYTEAKELREDTYPSWKISHYQIFQNLLVLLISCLLSLTKLQKD